MVSQFVAYGVRRVPQVPIPGPGKRQSFPCPLRSIAPRRRTMGIEKPRKEIAAGGGRCVRVPRTYLSGTCPIKI